VLDTGKDEGNPAPRGTDACLPVGRGGFQQPANPYKGDDMESRLIKQAIWFAVVLFAWTFFFLLVGPK